MRPLRVPDPPLADGVVQLRLWTLDDIDPVTELIVGDPELPRWTMMPVDYTRQDARTFIRNAPDLWRDGDAAVFCIADAERPAAILGDIDLRLRPGDIGQLGYWVARAHRGHGIAARAMRLVAAWAFDVLAIGRVELQIIVGNRASERAATRAGFRREGVLRSSIVHRGERRDTVMYSLLPSDLRSWSP